MHYIQYEELCRFFLAHELQISIKDVISTKMPSATLPGLVKYKNQIDLYWKNEDKLAQYVNIADAKWRNESDTVPIGRARELQFVRDDIKVHKAMLITNTGFDEGVIGVAEKYGIALHIVRPDFNHVILDLDLKDRKVIQTQLQELATNGKEIYTHKIIHRAFDFGTDGTAQTTVANKTGTHSKTIVQSPMNRMAQPPSHRRAPSGTQRVQGGQGGPRIGGRGRAVQKGSGPARGSGRKSPRGK